MKKTIIVMVQVKQGYANQFIDATNAARIAALKNETGCKSYDIFQDSSDENKFTLVETYADDAAIQKHKETEHFLTWRETVEKMMAGPRIGSKHNRVNWDGLEGGEY